MDRLLSRRGKDGSAHKREKSRDNTTDRKSFRFTPSFSPLPAAFSKSPGKAPPITQTTFSTIHATSADSRPGFFLQTRPISGADAVLALFKTDPQKKHDKELAHKIMSIKHRLQHQAEYSGIDDEQINYALSSKFADGDADKAYEILVLFQKSVEGQISEYNSDVQMLGAENRGNVTCYLDSLLFAMFARLGSFEPILHATFDDEPRRRLSTLIRLWVNMLRTGKLIQTDVTQHLQEALAACGWEDAARIQQQDTSEAFRFIAETLELPLLTLKVDIFHHATEDDKDDHKFVQERLLDVAVGDREDGQVQRLETCLEDYFNNKVEVTRLQRSYTLSSIQSSQLPDPEKEGVQHIELAETSTPNTPISPHPPSSPFTAMRRRATSVIRSRVEEGVEEKQDASHDSDAALTPTSMHKGSLRKEVTIPAWQFFNLIPWYTNARQPEKSPSSNAAVAAHFSETRPLLGICLKRYGVKDGRPYRKNTPVDIPQEMRLPHFIEDGRIPEDSIPMENFKLSLQSVICHRGNSLNEGHYIALVRGEGPISDGDSKSARRLSNSSRPPHYSEDRWYRFNDLANPRVKLVDYEEAVKNEMPYLLFYQVQPIIPMMTPAIASEHAPPSYSDSGVSMRVTSANSSLGSELPQLAQGYFDGVKDDLPATIRLPSEAERPQAEGSEARRPMPTSEQREAPPRQSLTLPEDRRESLAYTEGSLSSSSPSILATSAPGTPSDETTAQRLSRAASRFTKNGNKSRPTSQSGESRISATFSRLNLMKSKEQLSKVDPSSDKPRTSLDASRRKSVTIDESSLVANDHTLNRSKSKKGKKRSKSKEPSEKSEMDHNHHMHKGKGKAGEGPDRECSVM